jgi:hypothetical protein
LPLASASPSLKINIAIIIAFYINIKGNKKTHQPKGSRFIELSSYLGSLSLKKESPSAKKLMGSLFFNDLTQLTQQTQ